VSVRGDTGGPPERDGRVNPGQPRSPVVVADSVNAPQPDDPTPDPSGQPTPAEQFQQVTRRIHEPNRISRPCTIATAEMDINGMKLL
jgi:hypothetical protein